MFGSFRLQKEFFSRRCLNLIEFGLLSEHHAGTGLGFL